MGASDHGDTRHRKMSQIFENIELYEFGRMSPEADSTSERRLESMRTIWLFLILSTVFTACPQDVSARVAIHSRSPEEKKDALRQKDIQSGSFHYLQQITGLDILGLRLLYETSGATNYEEFSRSVVVSRNQNLDRQLVLRALYQSNLKDILQDFGLTEDQAEEAIDLAKKYLEAAAEHWEKLNER